MTLDILKKSSLSLCTNYLGADAFEVDNNIVNSILKDNMYKYASKIGVSYSENSISVHLLFSTMFLKLCCSALMFEDEPCDDTLKDMGNEISNMIVGQAKTILSNENMEHPDISTPESIDYFIIDGGSSVHISCNNSHFSVVLKG